MKVFRGRSFETDPERAVAEATNAFVDGVEPDIVFAFASTKQPAAAVAARLQQRFPHAPVVGCTTTGEQLDGEHCAGALVVTGLADSRIRWATAVLPDLANFDEAQAQRAAAQLFERLHVDREGLNPQEYFCLLFVDGLSQKEEAVSALVADAIEGIALLGGSAGDDLQFKETRVFHGGKALTNAAVLVLGHAPGAFSLLKHQHYTTTPRNLVITRADPAKRTVYEIDGYPAVEAYARALDLEPKDLHDGIVMLNPLTFGCHGEIYVRSVQRIDPDGSLVFYCGIEEGMVLEIGGHHDMRSALAASLQDLRERAGRAEFLLTFNCILRALEAKQGSHDDELSRLLRDASVSSLGFDTYGEQFNGLHINQTLVAIAFQPADIIPRSTARVSTQETRS